MLILHQRPKDAYSVTSMRYASQLALYELLYHVCQEADNHQKALLMDDRQHSASRSITELFGFHKPSAQALYRVRRPQLHLENLPIHVAYYLEDFQQRLVPTVNEDRATHFAVMNTYGDRLALFESEHEAKQFLLEKSSAEAKRKENQTPD